MVSVQQWLSVGHSFQAFFFLEMFGTTNQIFKKYSNSVRITWRDDMDQAFHSFYALLGEYLIHLVFISLLLETNTSVLRNYEYRGGYELLCSPNKIDLRKTRTNLDGLNVLGKFGRLQASTGFV